jgi:DNA-directed RNA polymerase specialized sigma24 family protein
MSIARDIAPLLPHLRRFSRALNGSLESGDAYLTATLQYLIEDPLSFPRDVSPRMALFKVFLDVWSATHLAELPPDPDDASAFDRNLAGLSPRTRQAFLLRTVENFSVSEIARIMDLDSGRVSQLLARGAHDIAQELATKILIIEDEPIIAMDLETIVEDLGHHVVGVARARRQAVALAKEREPELIMADIQLADGSSGLEAVNEILTRASKPVIFITGHPGIYLSAMANRPEPAFLLSKPFSPESVRAAVSQALFFDRRARAAA